MKTKIFDSPKVALEGLLVDGMTIMSSGFGLSGNPESLIPEIARRAYRTSRSSRTPESAPSA